MRNSWTKKNVWNEALKYNRRVDFMKNSPTGYDAARRNGWIEEVCSHMKVLRVATRTFEECKIIALKYDKLIDFQKKENAVCLYAERRGWIDLITTHMKRNIIWKNKKSEVHQVALKYKTRGEFCVKDERYYEVARRNGWLDEICSHMIYVGNVYKRLVYVYEFEDKTAYIGLTGNDIKRSNSHETSEKSPVFKHKEKTNLIPVKKIVTDGYIDAEHAAKIENETIEKYKHDGWNILNRTKGGNLGSSTRKWTDDKIKSTISKYISLSDFRKNEPNLVSALYKMKMYKEYTKDLVDDCIIFWDLETVKEKLSGFNNLKDFTKKYPGAYQWILKNKRDDLIYKLKQNWWEKEEIFETAKQYKTISKFKLSHTGMYNFVKKNGWLDELHKIIKPKFFWTKEKAWEITKKYDDYSLFRTENKSCYDTILKNGWNDCLEHLQKTIIHWTVETAKKEALKYTHRNEFITKSGGAYYFLKNKGLLDESTKHMELRNIKGYKEPLYECSVCGKKVGGKGNLMKWHEGNCKPNRPFAK